MGYQSLKMKGGVDVEQTPLLNEASFSYSKAVRFRDGLAEKTGGFAHLNTTPFLGICTGMHTWADLAGNPYIAVGTDQALDLFFAGLTIDITPLRATSDNAVKFSTQAGVNTVTINDPTNGAQVGSRVNIVVPVSVGGLIIQGLYTVQSVIDTDHYTITAASPATGTVTDGGAVPSFTTIMGNAPIEVDLDNHGLVAGNSFGVQIQTLVGGITIGVTDYVVEAPVTTNSFFITPGATASSGATVSENSGNAHIEYLVAPGLQSATYETDGGYGQGNYGSGQYGGASEAAVLDPLRQWFLGNFGQDLVGNYTGSPILVWTPPAEINNPAVFINTDNFPGAMDPPDQVNISFVATPQRMIIALGCTEVGSDTFDPNLVRWCDVDDFTDWVASTTNQAGSYRIPSGSKLTGGITAPNFTVIWTDVDMWLMSYLGGTAQFELVWGFQKVADAVDLLCARACAVFRNLVFFLSSNGMYVFDGSRISLVPCSVWDKFWKNLNRLQVDKVNMQVNSYFQEISIAFPSAAGNGTVDSKITYNIRENIWSYDDAPSLLPRTAWVDEDVYGAPCGTDLSGYIQQQDSEGVYDADGAPLPASIRTGWFSVGEGTLLQMMERLEADLICQGGTATLQVTVFAKDYAIENPAYPVRTYGPYSWTPGSGPPYFITRARGRFFSIMFSSSDLGVFWRTGNTRMFIQNAGKRP